MTFKFTRICHLLRWDERMLICRSSLKTAPCGWVRCLSYHGAAGVGNCPYRKGVLNLCLQFVQPRATFYSNSSCFKEESPLTWGYLVFLQTNLKVTSDLLQDGEGCQMPMMDLMYLQRSSLSWDFETFFWTLKTGSTKEHWGLLRYLWIVAYIGAWWCHQVCSLNENSWMVWVLLKA